MKPITVSRILFTPLHETLGRTIIFLTARRTCRRSASCRSRMRLIPELIRKPKFPGRAGNPFVLLCLAPRGVFPDPLSHPRGGELLPRHFTLTLLRRSSERRFIFCDTIRRSRITRGLPDFHRARYLVVSGLSSDSRRNQRPSPIGFVGKIARTSGKSTAE